MRHLLTVRVSANETLCEPTLSWDFLYGLIFSSSSISPLGDTASPFSLIKKQVWTASERHTSYFFCKVWKLIFNTLTDEQLRLRGNDAAYYLANRDHMDSSVIVLHYIFDSVSIKTAKKHLAKGKRQM